MKPRVAIALVMAVIGASSLTPGLAAAQPTPPQMHSVAGGGSCTTETALAGDAFPVGLPCNGVKATSVPIINARWVAALPDASYLYVDEGDDLVQDVSGGIVTTVAGGGASCSYARASCDGDAATAVALDDPVSAAPLPGGGFLITEYAGGRVLMVSPGPPGTATISTIAGTGENAPDNGASGPATSIPLNEPTDAEPTADGDVLVANSGSNDIRDVAPDGTISTVAGGGTCNDSTTSCTGLAANQIVLNDPNSVSPIDGGSGGYLIAEYGADAIDQVSQVAPSGVFATVAGTPGEHGFGGDGGLATDALLNAPAQALALAGGGFLIADSHNDAIRQVSPGGTITTIAGTPGPPSVGGDGGPATSALLANPMAASPLPNGNVLIADEDNNLIREITIPPTSTVTLSPASPNGNNGWYTSSPTAIVTATEKATINCTLDPGAAPPVFAAMQPGCSFTGKGASIAGNGVHNLYAASMNSFGDQEEPIDAVVMIDTTPPTVSCNGTPSFSAGTRRATVSATVTDAISGPLAPTISAGANTSRLGRHGLWLVGENNAGVPTQIFCGYTVVPLDLKPTPRVTAVVTSGHSGATVRQLSAGRVPDAAVVNVTCQGSGCPFSSAVRVTGHECRGKPCQAGVGKHYRRPRSVDLTSLFASAALVPGDRLMVSVTQRNRVGWVFVLTVRSNKRPSYQVTCLAPGSTKPGRGCAPPPSAR
jgi:hypothetical protein